MITRLFIALALLSLAAAAAAQGRIHSLALEIALSEFRAPVTTNGAATFKECRDCETQIVRVTPNTAYVVNGNRVRLEAFRETLAEVDDREGTPVIVLHHLESDTIVSLSVSL